MWVTNSLKTTLYLFTVSTKPTMTNAVPTGCPKRKQGFILFQVSSIQSNQYLFLPITQFQTVDGVSQVLRQKAIYKNNCELVSRNPGFTLGIFRND